MTVSCHNLHNCGKIWVYGNNDVTCSPPPSQATQASQASYIISNSIRYMNLALLQSSCFHEWDTSLSITLLSFLWNEDNNFHSPSHYFWVKQRDICKVFHIKERSIGAFVESLVWAEAQVCLQGCPESKHCWTSSFPILRKWVILWNCEQLR